MSEEQLRLIGVVRAAPKLDVRDGRFAARGIGLAMVELEKRGLATASFASDECAPAIVSPPHLAAHRGGNVARSSVLHLCRRGHAWFGGLREPRALHVLDEQRDRPVEDLGGVA
jgi:hypothetical protein